MSAVSLTAAALVAAVLGCGAAGALGQVARARAEVDAAADLAALAVASRVVRGEPHATACAVAVPLVAPEGLTVTGCGVDGEQVLLQVRLDLRVLGTVLPVTGRARAGPAGPDPEAGMP